MFLVISGARCGLVGACPPENCQFTLTFDPIGPRLKALQHGGFAWARLRRPKFRWKDRRMIDGPDRAIARLGGADSESSVESLASRALTVLASKRASTASMMSDHFIDNLLEAVRAIEPGRRRAVIADMLGARIRREDIVDFYIPAVARRLGAAWCDDGLSFAEVTIGSARLQGILRDLGREWFDDSVRDGASSGIAVIVDEAEFHTLGALVLASQFRRMGISVRAMIGQPREKIFETVENGQFDAILLSAAGGETLARLRHVVEKIRAVSDRPVPIVIGGSIVEDEAEVRTQTGADYVTSDPREVVRLCGLTASAPGASQRVRPD